MAATIGERTLTPLSFHLALVSALRELEPGQWRWFQSDDYGQKYAATVKVELLRATYRLPVDSNQRLYAIGREVSDKLGVDAPLTLYQAQEDAGGLNAGLFFLPSEAHLVLRGPVTQLLSEPELYALFGHELAHHKLWTTAEGSFRTAASLIEHMAGHERHAPSHVQTALRQRRWTEIYADRGSLVASEDLNTAVSLLVKMTAGLREVDPLSYLAQAEEALLAPHSPQDSRTHPETFIRAVALKSWHAGEGEERIAQLVEGPCEMEALDLLQQRRLCDATAELIGLVLAPSWMRTDSTLAHARRFVPDLELKNDTPLCTLAIDSDSVAEYVSYVLLDFGMADPDIEEVSLARVAQLSAQLGVEAAFAKIARKELRLSAASFAELKQRGAELASRPDLSPVAAEVGAP
jgi:Zn-dependent protease with chaperone function